MRNSQQWITDSELLLAIHKFYKYYSNIIVVVAKDSVIILNRSKLQICTEILCKLASSGPMSLRNISEVLDIKETFLKKHLKLLEDSSLVIKENFGKNKIFFTLTENGLDTLKFLGNIYIIQKNDRKPLAISI